MSILIKTQTHSSDLNKQETLSMDLKLDHESVLVLF